MPRDIRTDLTIDADSLDTCWLQQPRIYFYWAKKLAAAQKAADEAKREVDVTYADLSKAMRADPAEFDLTKATDEAVKAAIPSCKDYKDAQDSYNEAMYEVRILASAVEALQHRKRAMEKLVDLHGQQYFSEPRAKGAAARDAIENMATRKALRRREQDDE